ncbi:MAG: PilN domain-containing protein [bacterium]
MIKINLIPNETVKKRSQGDLMIAGILIGGLVLFAFAGTFVYRKAKKARLKKELITAQNELKKYQDIVNQVEALKQEKTALEQRRNVIKSLLAGRLLYPKFLDQLIAGIPQGIWITNCSTNNEGQNSLGIQIQATSFSNFAIADWITTLESSKDFSNVELGSISASEQEVGKSKRKQLILVFSIKFSYRLT